MNKLNFNDVIALVPKLKWEKNYIKSGNYPSKVWYTARIKEGDKIMNIGQILPESSFQLSKNNRRYGFSDTSTVLLDTAITKLNTQWGLKVHIMKSPMEKLENGSEIAPNSIKIDFTEETLVGFFDKIWRNNVRGIAKRSPMIALKNRPEPCDYLTTIDEIAWTDRTKFIDIYVYTLDMSNAVIRLAVVVPETGFNHYIVQPY